MGESPHRLCWSISGENFSGIDQRIFKVDRSISCKYSNLKSNHREVAIYDIPTIIVSGNGSNFCSKEIEAKMAYITTGQLHTIPHPTD